jgi:hypothetical protein
VHRASSRVLEALEIFFDLQGYAGLKKKPSTSGAGSG